MKSVPITDIVKGDAFTLEGDLDTSIVGWKLRCEIFDNCGHCIKLATENSGGSDEQIEITDDANGEFIINVESDETTCFEDKSFIEIEGETSEGKKFTINQGSINFIPEQITWNEP